MFKPSAAIVLLALGTVGLAFPAEVELREVMARVQRELKRFETTLPDFVCSEKVSSRIWVKGEFRGGTITESQFTCRRIDNPRTQQRFTESREVTKVNGKPVKKGKKLEGPVVLGGGFASILNATFSARNVPFQTYRIVGSERIDGKPVLVIEYATRDGQRGLTFGFEGKFVFTTDTGKAWVDPQTMQVVRLTRHYAGLPKPVEVTVEVDYALVSFDGASFRMPGRVKAEFKPLEAKRAEVRDFIAEYSNYRKFAVSSGISFAPPETSEPSKQP